MNEYEFQLESPISGILALNSLGNSTIPVISKDATGFYKENCMVCFFSQEHQSGVLFEVTDYQENVNCFQIVWTGKVTEQLTRNYSLRQATDHAACAIALLLLVESTEYTAIEQAAIGTKLLPDPARETGRSSKLQSRC